MTNGSEAEALDGHTSVGDSDRREDPVKVAIVGTGNVGSALARRLSSAGHDVIVTSTTPAEVEAVAKEVGGQSLGSNVDAILAAGIVILAVPYEAIASIIDEAGEALDDKILVDVTNRFGGEEPGAVVDGSSNAEQVASMAPSARVVKAFNTVLASRQADPRVNDMPVDNFVASSDADAKAKVVELIRSIGMRPIDAGSLSSARILEAMGTLNMYLNMQGGSWQTAWKLIEPAA
jgi:NADPH-dependent F420 reductase